MHHMVLPMSVELAQVKPFLMCHQPITMALIHLMLNF
jgi:hypothetical protein